MDLCNGRFQNTYLNFLYVNKTKNMDKIHETILNKPFSKENNLYDERNLIKELFLKRIKEGMPYEEYTLWSSSIKTIKDPYITIVIDDLIKIFSKSNEELINIITNEINFHNYKFLISKKDSKEFETSTIKPHYSILILSEALNDMKKYILNFSLLLVKENGNSKKGCEDILRDLNSQESLYYQTLRQLFISNFSYLENSIFKDIYDFMLLTLRSEFKKIIKTKYEEIKSNPINSYLKYVEKQPLSKRTGYMKYFSSKQ